MNKKQSLIVFIVSIIPTVIFINLMIYYFPMTGLGRILSVPMTLIINSIIIMFFIYAMNFRLKNMKRKFSINILIWLIFIIITLVVVISMHPQEGGPSTWVMIIERFKEK
ncbi:MAG: hypothetical protein NAG76_18665 [Candidatus Pristimantibacillus lignocellulolyticus]|uniref:Uncharacterized protein n=1 Tax=Candidatus Pristimantibacillus lignocellulolyticus TaxID=2994561 RepID=A0A9J6ZCR9_9BACL|nr:MAG: hypothetical protein NAG76_18665 [Candidatus Pristimantibacillus lignocellulolyticus]